LPLVAIAINRPGRSVKKATFCSIPAVGLVEITASEGTAHVRTPKSRLTRELRQCQYECSTPPPPLFIATKSKMTCPPNVNRISRKRRNATSSHAKLSRVRLEKFENRPRWGTFRLFATSKLRLKRMNRAYDTFPVADYSL